MKTTLLKLVMMLALTLLPSYAFASEALPDDDGADEFSNEAVVTDAELSTQRGGFSIGGMNISFQYHGLAMVNGVVVTSSTFNLDDFNTATQAMQHMMITNSTNDAVIKVMHEMNIQIEGGLAVLNSRAQMSQVDYQGLIALR